jgi:ELWxxDGT repeat protein
MPLPVFPVRRNLLCCVALLAAVFSGRAALAQQFIQSLAYAHSIDYEYNPYLTPAGGILFFAYNDGKQGSELWKSDGTAAGTFMVKDIYPGQSGSGPRHLFNYNGTLFFSATTNATGTELWKSDGTAAGTVMVKELYPSSYYGSNPNTFTVYGNRLFFFAFNAHSLTLWRTDGTAGGTVPVKEIGDAAYGYSALYEADGLLYFGKYHVSQYMLFRSDGTDAGTYPIDTLDAGYRIQSINRQTLCYSAKGALWQIARRDAKPQLLARFPVLETYASYEVDNFTEVGNTLFFSKRNANHQSPNVEELWKSDGTPQGTGLVKTFPWTRHSSFSHIQNFISFRGKLFFHGGETNGSALWQSDGTEGGTVKVSDASLGNADWQPVRPVVAGDYLYFRNSGELWRSDGTAAGTGLFLKTNATASSRLSSLANAAGTLFFTATPGKDEYGRDMALWSSKPAPKLEVTAGWQPLSYTSTIDFGKSAVDARATRTITLRNTGRAVLALGGITASGKGFSVVGEVPTLLSPGESKAVVLRYYPATGGSHTGTLRIFSNDPVAGSFEASLTGQADAPVAQQDYEALVALYQVTDGANWFGTGWDISRNGVSSGWQGVTVANGRVVRLDLSSANLVGRLPEALGNLTELAYLRLDHNRLQGPIPAGLGKLKKLGSLHLGDNQLSGSIPAAIGACTDLQVLSLGQNQLTGEIPVEIGQLANLTEFDVHNNRLTGPVPEALAALKNLSDISLRDNFFTGLPRFTQPANSSYFTLRVSNNQLTFKDLEPNLPLFLDPAFYAPQRRIGSSDSYLIDGTFTALQLTLPARAVDAQYAYQWTKDGKDIPGATLATYALPAGALGAEAVYSCKITYANVSGLTLERADVYVQKPVSNAEHAVLVALYRSTDGGNWVNKAGWNLAANTVSNEWFGVKIENGHVTGLDFGAGGNNLNGTLPAELGNLPYLRRLVLTGNPQLRGDVPSGLGNLKNLTVLVLSANQLTGPIPAGIWQLNKLLTLSLAGNALSGVLPERVDSLQHLTGLLLNNNRFSGNIGAVAGLKKLEYLSLARNRFSGEVPLVMGGLTALSWLDLSHNQLSGRIPAALGNLRGLHQLYLNNNQFTGTFPDSLAALALSNNFPVRAEHNRLTALPGLSGATPTNGWGLIGVASNRLTFKDIEPNLRFLSSYRLQDSVGVAQSYSLLPGQPLVLRLADSLRGYNNRYQWFRDGLLLEGATGPEWSVDQAGGYTCTISNAVVPNLALHHRPFRVVAEGTIPARVRITRATVGKTSRWVPWWAPCRFPAARASTRLTSTAAWETTPSLRWKATAYKPARYWITSRRAAIRFG